MIFSVFRYIILRWIR